MLLLIDNNCQNGIKNIQKLNIPAYTSCISIEQSLTEIKGIKQIYECASDSISIKQNSPNPFNPTTVNTNLRSDISKKSFVIFDTHNFQKKK
jgi:hypothetical protein